MEKEIFELMTKMYSEMTEIKSEIKEMKTEFNNKFDSLENKVDKGFKETNDRIDGLLDGTRETIVNEVSEEINKKVDNLNSRLEVIELATKAISKDVKFTKHKIYETEEDVFDIKDHLKIIK